MTLFLSNKSRTLPVENRKNIAVIALSPDGNVLVSIDEGSLGYCKILRVLIISCRWQSIACKFQEGRRFAQFQLPKTGEGHTIFT